MGLFNRALSVPVDDDDSLDPQGMALELIDTIHDQDLAGLANLTPEQRADQARARKALYEYVDAVWEDAKCRGLNPGGDPAWSGWAGLRDLTLALMTEALELQDDTEE
jgi:hypothetical protein